MLGSVLTIARQTFKAMRNTMTNSNNFAGQYVVKLPYLLAFSENIPQTNFRNEFLWGLPRVLSNVLKYFFILVPRGPFGFCWSSVNSSLVSTESNSPKKASALLDGSMVPKCYCLLACGLSRPDRSSGSSAMLGFLACSQQFIM